MRFFIFIFLQLIGIFGYSQIMIHFGSGSFQVPDSSVSTLKMIAHKYIKCQDVISILGYADSIGSDEINQTLSKKRAEEVRSMLFKLGLADASVIEHPTVLINSYGKRFPIASNKTRTGRQLNRRVEITIESQKCEQQVEEPPIENLYNQIQDNGEEFCINPLRDTTLVGKGGSIVYYKAGTFENTPNCTCIRIELQEYFKKSSLILNNLTTTSNEAALESGGMTRVLGFCGKDTLKFRSGKYMIVMVPADTLLPGMKLLSANRDRQSDYLNWKIDKDYSELDEIDWNKLFMACNYRGDGNTQPSRKCHLFFCKISRFLFGSKKEKEVEQVNNKMREESELIKNYNFDEKQLGEALLKSKSANPDALKYYVYKNANWDYHNIDRYKEGLKFTDFVVDERVNFSIDVKLLYKESKTVLPSTKKGNYIFKNVFENKEVWIIGLKYKDNLSAYLSLNLENTTSKKTKLDFKIVSIEQLKTLLKELD